MESFAFKFIEESNKIEGILRRPLHVEIDEYHRFMALKEITLKDLEKFISIYQPGAILRNQLGLDVRVGDYFPPKGDILIKTRLLDILADAEAAVTKWQSVPRLRATRAYNIHVDYEKLHPFTDGNGRSGRMLWMWVMKEAPLGFLHTFYYQALGAAR